MVQTAPQSNVNVSLYSYPQTDLYTPASTAASAKSIRRVSSSLALNKDTFASNEVRPDQQISDMRHGMRSGRGSISGELSCTSYDDFLAALMRNTWVAGVTVLPADATGGVTFTGTAGADSGTVTFGGASLQGKGVKIGDAIRFAGLTGAGVANNGVNFRVLGIAGATATIAPAPTAVGTAQTAGWTSGVVGRKLTNGLLKPALTIEQAFLDLDASELFFGCRIGGASINLPPSGMATASFDVMSRDFGIYEGANSPYFLAPLAPSNTAIQAGVDGYMRANGVGRVAVTGFSLNVSLGLSSPPVVGSKLAPEIFYGRSVVTGQITALLDSTDLLKAFLSEGIVDVAALVQTSPDAATGLQDFLSFGAQRVKLTGASHDIGADGGVVAQLPFQALLQTGGAGTNYDQTTLTIQSSV